MIALRLAVLSLLALPTILSAATSLAALPCGCVAPAPPMAQSVVPAPPRNSWIFMRSRYTHDPATGARVAQYDMKPPVEPLDDPRLVTSGYSRSRIIVRGADGSVDTTYRVQSYGNAAGVNDAAAERWHDAWRGSGYGGAYYGYGGYGPVPFAGGVPPYAIPYGGFYGGWGGVGPVVKPVYPPGYDYRNGPLVQGGGFGYGPGYGVPDGGRLDPDAAEGYREQLPRTPDAEFYNRHVPGGQSAP